MTYTEIIARVKSICQQPAEDSGWWLNTMWLIVLNDVHNNLVEDVKLLVTSDTTQSTVAGQNYVTIPDTIITPTIVYVDGEKLPYKSQNSLNVILPGWVESGNSKPSYFFIEKNIIYFNCPADSVYSVVIWGTEAVTEMSATQETPFNGLGYLQLFSSVLIMKLAAEFFISTSDYEKAQIFERRYEVDKERMRDRINGGVKEENITFQAQPRNYTDEV